MRFTPDQGYGVTIKAFWPHGRHGLKYGPLELRLPPQRFTMLPYTTQVIFHHI